MSFSLIAQLNVMATQTKGEILLNPCHAKYFDILHSLPQFYPVNLQHSSYKYVFTSKSGKQCGS